MPSPANPCLQRTFNGYAPELEPVRTRCPTHTLPLLNRYAPITQQVRMCVLIPQQPTNPQSMKTPIFPYTKTFLSEERPVKLFLISNLLKHSYMSEIREIYYKELKNPKTYQEAEQIATMLRSQFGINKNPEELQLSDDQYANKIIDCTNAITQTEEMLLEGLNIEKDFAKFFTQEIKKKQHLHHLVIQIGGIASTIFEILGEYDMGEVSKEDCKYWVQFFIHSNKSKHIEGFHLRQIFAQTLDLFWVTFQAFYNINSEETYNQDAPL